MPSPAPCTAAVLPLSQPAPPPTPTLSGPSPTPTVAISDNVSLDQLLRDIDAPNTSTDTSTSSKGISPPFQPQAASTQQHSFVSPDVSPTVGARPQSTVSYPPGEYRKLRQQYIEQNFCSGGACTTLNRYLHHRLRRAVNLTLLCAVFCGKRRSRRLSLTKTLLLKKVWHNSTTSMFERSPNSLKLRPFFHPHFSYFISLFCVCSLIIVAIKHTRSLQLSNLVIYLRVIISEFLETPDLHSRSVISIIPINTTIM